MSQLSQASILAVCTRHQWHGEGYEQALGGSLGAPLYSEKKESYIETEHRGWALLIGESRVIEWKSDGAEKASTFFRSSAKPLQSAVLLDYGAESVLTPQEFAIACGSHSGTKEHLDWVEQILSRLSHTGSQLLWCGAQAPVDAAAQQALLQAQEQSTPRHNNCSGKHAGMLWVCEQAGWDTATYWHPEHPLQQKIIDVISHYGDIAKENIAIGLDGCGVPTFYLSLKTMANLYNALVSEKKFSPIINAMTAYPDLVSGIGRIDWAIMKTSQGQLLSKVGADGLICVANRKTKQALVLKLADGNQAIRDHLIVHYLKKLGWLSKDQCLSQPCQPFYETVRYNTRQQPVGQIQHWVFPNSA